jgi:hypothetical protein
LNEENKLPHSISLNFSFPFFFSMRREGIREIKRSRLPRAIVAIFLFHPARDITQPDFKRIGFASRRNSRFHLETAPRAFTLLKAGLKTVDKRRPQAAHS